MTAHMEPSPDSIRGENSIGPAPDLRPGTGEADTALPSPDLIRGGSTLGPTPDPLVPSPDLIRGGSALGPAPARWPGTGEADPRLSLNQACVKRASLADALDATVTGGLAAIGLWREPVAAVGLPTAAAMLADSGLRFTTLCRGGFFTMPEGPARRAALDDNRRAIDETATLAAAGAPGSRAVLVLVAGGIPDGSRDLVGARGRVRDALEELAPHAEAAGVTLAIEPLHPMYASDRAVVSTLGQALDLAAGFAPQVVGVTVDTFHIWWDPQVIEQIGRAGREGRIATYQVCDWRTPLPADVLAARHYPGDGVIDFGPLTQAVLQTGYDGDIEVELFNEDIWADDPHRVVRRVAASFGEAISPHLTP